MYRDLKQGWCRWCHNKNFRHLFFHFIAVPSVIWRACYMRNIRSLYTVYSPRHSSEHENTLGCITHDHLWPTEASIYTMVFHIIGLPVIVDRFLPSSDSDLRRPSADLDSAAWRVPPYLSSDLMHRVLRLFLFYHPDVWLSVTISCVWHTFRYIYLVTVLSLVG